jgi:hypothetical protein
MKTILLACVLVLLALFAMSPAQPRTRRLR